MDFSPSDIVAHEFVEHYYGRLGEAPLQLSQFYVDTAKISRPRQTVIRRPISVSSLLDINEDLNPLVFGRAESVKITACDSQICAIGIIVLVHGYFCFSGTADRKFIHIFYLVPRDPTFRRSIHNDILQYVDEQSEISVSAAVNNGDAPPDLIGMLNQEMGMLNQEMGMLNQEMGNVGFNDQFVPMEDGPAGLDAAGLDAAGLDAAGLDAAGFDAAWFDAAGINAAVFNAAGFNVLGAPDPAFNGWAAFNDWGAPHPAFNGWADPDNP